MSSIVMEWFENVNLQQWLIFVGAALLSALVYSQVTKTRKRLPPGPWGLPIVGYLPFLGSEPHKTFAKLSEKYGSIISVYFGSQHTVILNDYETMKETLSHSSALDRAPLIFDQVTEGKSIGFGVTNGPTWEEQRRFVMHSMRDLGLGRGAWQVLLREEINSFLDDIGRTQGHPTDISDILCDSLTNNIVSLLIGRRLSKDSEKDKLRLMHEFAAEILKFSNPSHPAAIFPRLRGFFNFFKIGGYHRLTAVTKETNAFFRDEITKHKSSPTSEGEKDFITLYLEQMKKLQSSVDKSKHYFSEEELAGSVVQLLLGGSDTTANSMLWTYPLMVAHPHIQSKIQAELDSVFGRDGQINYEDRHLVPYTFATLLEMERFASIVPLSSNRSAREDFTIRGYTIPKDSQMIGNLWSIHNDPRYWDRPEEFLPERFLSDDEKKLLRLPSYLPFSVGRRNCPGETVAMMTLFLYFASTLRRFAISAPPNKKVRFDVARGLVTQIKSQELCFCERDL